MVREVEEEVRRLAPPAVREYVEKCLKEAGAIAARVREEGVVAYARAARFLEDTLYEAINKAWLPSFVRADMERELEHLRETFIRDWKAVFGVAAMLEFLREEAKGGILAPPARAAPEAQPSLPADLLHLLAETEKLAQELRAALEKRDYTRAADMLPAYVERLVRLSGAPDKETAEWAKTELEKLDEVLLEHYHTLCDRLGGEPFAAVKSERLMFELALSLAHASPDAAKPLLDRIPDKRLRDYAAGYLEAARAYAKAGEEVGEQAWARIHEEFSSLPSEEARAGFLAYAIERSLPLINFEKIGSAARIVEEAFWDEAKRLAVNPEPADWRALLDEFAKTCDPEVLGKALAHAALAGEGDRIMEDWRVKGFIEKCDGDVARFDVWVVQRPRAEEELERGVRACAERLREIEEGIAELRSWVPEPGEATSLRMLRELELARLREEVRERWDQLDEVEAQAHSFAKLADRYLLPRHAVDSLLDWIRRQREALVDLDAMLK
jgi:hypothetical protein